MSYRQRWLAVWGLVADDLTELEDVAGDAHYNAWELGHHLEHCAVELRRVVKLLYHREAHAQPVWDLVPRLEAVAEALETIAGDPDGHVPTIYEGTAKLRAELLEIADEAKRFARGGGI